ncbi:MAG: thioredoxin domain-containing protein [Gemmatimonadota bacterium]
MSFRFSPRPNRARAINWRSWSAEAFAEAAAADRPILLNLTAVWCHWCHLMDETTYSEAELIQLINEQLSPIRVDADQHPHVQDRYIAGGWPTNAFLTPTGEVLWSGTYVPAEQFTQVAQGVLGAWAERRAELKAEIERRRKALEAARGRHHVVGLVRREAADDVLSAIIDAYDERNGGFGKDPKFPSVDAIELLFIHGSRNNTDYLRMAEHSLDGMLAGELADRKQGGFYRYATHEDWTAPREEKLLSVNAAMLRIYALGAHVQERTDWRRAAEGIVAWADQKLRRADGLWSGSDAEGDDVLYTSYNAQWIRALASAGGRLGNSEWVARARTAFDTLLQRMSASGNVLFHYQRDGEAPQLDFLLGDAVETARAATALAQTTGEQAYLAHARRITSGMEQLFWAEDGGFWDRTRGVHEVGVLRYREKPFDLNAEATRLLNDLTVATGDRRYRALAERILAILSPQAGRYGVAGAGYALAAAEFFDPPFQIVVVGTGPAAGALRMAALTLPLMSRRVWTMPEGGRVGPLNFAPQPKPVAYIAGSRGTSAPISQSERLQEALASLR